MSSGRKKVYQKDMTDSHKAYFSTHEGFLEKGKTYIVMYEVTPDCDDFKILDRNCNFTASKMKIRDVDELH